MKNTSSTPPVPARDTAQDRDHRAEHAEHRQHPGVETALAELGEHHRDDDRQQGQEEERRVDPVLGRDPDQQRPDQHHQSAERGDGEDHRRPARERDGADGLDAAHATPTSSTRSHGGPSTFMTCGAKAGDSASTRRTGPDETTSPSAMHHDLVGDQRGELDVVGGHQDRPARRRPARAGRRPGPAWRSSRGRAWARRAGRPGGFAGEDQGQGEGEPLALGQVARVPVAGDARDERVEELAGPLSPGRALLVDGLEVEQVGGVLRQQPDQRPSYGGLDLGGVGAADVHRARAPRSRALERPQQRGLAGAVAAHQRGDPRRQVQRHLADRDRPAVDDA